MALKMLAFVLAAAVMFEFGQRIKADDTMASIPLPLRKYPMNGSIYGKRADYDPEAESEPRVAANVQPPRRFLPFNGSIYGKRADSETAVDNSRPANPPANRRYLPLNGSIYGKRASAYEAAIENPRPANAPAPAPRRYLPLNGSIYGKRSADEGLQGLQATCEAAITACVEWFPAVGEMK